MFLIATLTDHCICLLIKCKYIVINNIIHEQSSEIPTSADELHQKRQTLERGLGYGDIGRIALGNCGKIVIDFAVWFTQMMTCVCYFIFIGNAIVSIYPLAPALIPLNNSNLTTESLVRQPVGLHNLIFPESLNNNSCMTRGYKDEDKTKMKNRHKNLAQKVLLSESDNFAQTATSKPENYTSVEPGSTPKSENMTTPIPTPSDVMISTAPSLKLLVMIPLPLFLITALVRNIRLLSPFSTIATLSLFVGAIAVLVYMLIGGYKFVRWKKAILSYPHVHNKE